MRPGDKAQMRYEMLGLAAFFGIVLALSAIGYGLSLLLR